MAGMQNSALAQILDGQQLRYELVELYVDTANSGKSKFAFPTNFNLQGKRVLFIDAFSDDVISVSPQGNDVITTAIFIKSFLTLYTMTIDRENLQQIAFPSLNPMSVTGGTTPFVQERILLNNAQTDWNKCYVEVGGTIGVGDISFLFGVWYVDL
jgi:hypothetical protein